MNNNDTRAAWEYHNGTKLPGGRLMDPNHRFDPGRPPLLLKVYLGLDTMPLCLAGPARAVPALSAIAAEGPPKGTESTPGIGELAALLNHSAGVTKKKISYPWGATHFRAAACTGALYHIEMYVVCGDLPGLEAGVYHFEPQEMALTRLRAGDYRGTLLDATGNEPSVAEAPLALVLTDVFWRNACKFQAREYRHAFWDSGTILSNTLAMASTQGHAAKIVAGFADGTVNALLGLDERKEAAIALAAIGHSPEASHKRSPDIVPLGVETAPVSSGEKEFPAIHRMHVASSLADGAEAAAWRKGKLRRASRPVSGRLTPLTRLKQDRLPSPAIEEVIQRRGSARSFSESPIAFSQLSSVLREALSGVQADFTGPAVVSLYEAYLIVNAVEGLAPGAYFYHRERQALELLEEGEFRQEAGHLAFDQALAAEASVNIYFMADLGPVLDRFGNRGYRAAQLEASIAAGRVYLAAYAQGQPVGARGLTFYDDAVTDFFSPHAKGKSVMFLMAVGKRARRHLG